MMKYLILAFSILFSCSLNAYTKEFKVNYHPELGDYTIDLFLDNNFSRPIKVLLDTGSSNLNIISTRTKGDDFLTKDIIYFGFSPKKHRLLGAFFIKYGGSEGQVHVHEVPVHLSRNIYLKSYGTGFYQSGQNLINILGLGLPGAHKKPKESKFSPLLIEAEKKQYDFNSQFSLLLCKQKGESKFILGRLPQDMASLKAHKLPVYGKALYFVNHLGYSVKNSKQITKFSEPVKALIDSGTTGKIIYPSPHVDELISALKKQITGKNKLIPDPFWSGGVCIPQRYINISDFPEVKFYFKDENDKTIPLTIPPDKYITSGGCEKGFYQLAFIKTHEYPSHKKTKAHKRHPPGSIIFGTPLLENYLTTYHYGDNPYVIFYENSNRLCKDNK